MSPKSDGRFDDLMSTLHQGKTEKSKRSDVQTSGSDECSDVQTSKSKDPNYQRTTVYLPKVLHRKLKAAAAIDGREMSEVIEDLIDEWLKSKDA